MNTLDSQADRERRFRLWIVFSLLLGALSTALGIVAEMIWGGIVESIVAASIGFLIFDALAYEMLGLGVAGDETDSAACIGTGVSFEEGVPTRN